VKDLEKSINFYVNVLSMKLKVENGKYSVYYGKQKINFHRKPGEFTPAAKYPTSGSADLCFEVQIEGKDAKEKINSIYHYIVSKGIPIEVGPVMRLGAKGPMWSVYFRDPDENLIELCVY
jgi:catechol 2,3-dioxygenase-like lactoylglutathione lyase family enzyme